MRATVMRGGELVVDEIADPVPEAGQVLVRTLACGICGSDLHALRHGEQLIEMGHETLQADPDAPFNTTVMDLSQDVVLGHEFVGEVVDLGAGSTKCKVGDVVVSLPVVLDTTGLHPVGFSNRYPGGYGEMIVLNDALALDVPNGLDARHAALTEPMAVGLHAVNRSRIAAGGTALVLGCGPVGLAVIASLRVHGAGSIVATDFSPARRALALRMGADEAVDPRQEPAIDAWRRVAGSKPAGPLTIFEAVGVPGMLDDAMRMAPKDTHIMVVGVCMEADTIRPMRGITRELTIGFALAYDAEEFTETLRRIAEGELDVTPLITGSVPVDGIAGAFEALADPEAHAKILVVPTA